MIHPIVLFVTTLASGTHYLDDFAVSQLGLSKLPSEVKSAVQFVPNKIYGLLRAAVSKATLPGAPSGKLYQGALTDVLPIGDNYQLWEARDDHGKAHVKVAKKNAQGQFVLFAELNEASFTTAASKEHIRNLIEAAKAYSAELDRQKKTPTPDGKELLKSKQAAVSALQNLVKTDIEQDACAALGVGCFAAGTKLWTPDGYRNVEDIQPNERVFARNEYDPNGPIEAKIVEEKFERTGRILHLHLQGERGSVSSLIIRTTPEHPFYVRERGWTEAGALQAGDEIRTDSGWMAVEEVFDTGEYAKVYNLRVADWHTYFVGEGSAAWAHNAECATNFNDLTAEQKAKVALAFQYADQAVALKNQMSTTKTVAISSSLKTISGFAATGQPSGFAAITPQNVLNYAASFTPPITIRGNGLMDQGITGQYYASHAEKKMAVAIASDLSAPIGVSQAMCLDCGTGSQADPTNFFSQLANRTGKTLVVSEPTICRIFLPGGRILRVSRSSI